MSHQTFGDAILVPEVDSFIDTDDAVHVAMFTLVVITAAKLVQLSKSNRLIHLITSAPLWIFSTLNTPSFGVNVEK